MSDTKATVLGISIFIWEVICHVTDTLRRPYGSSGSDYLGGYLPCY